MKRTLIFLALIAASTASAEPWTYRGTLNDGGKPANGEYDLRLTLVNEAGTKSLTPAITLNDVAVKDGSFSAEVDFGIDLSQAPTLKLKTEVSQGGSGFMALGEPTRFDAKAALAGICWDTTGNNVAPGEFLGSTNNVPLVFKANNAEVLRISGGLAVGGVNIVAGASVNTVAPGGFGQTVSGGGDARTFCGVAGNEVCKNATLNSLGTVSGGSNNIAAGLATVSGGIANSALGGSSTVSGGSSNCAGGDSSWAGGSRAKIRPGNEVGDGNCVVNSGDADGDNGTFMWSDSLGADFVSAGQNQFLVRASGGVYLGGDTSNPVIPGGRFINTSSGAHLTNGGVWTNASSRSLKQGFVAVNPIQVLNKLVALPISTWVYKSSTEGQHIGPMAEDFKDAFGLAGDGKSIGTVDADGVALAAIQGLNQKLVAEQAKSAHLQRELIELKAAVQDLQRAKPGE